MNNEINDGGSAFPVLEQGGDGRLELGNPGMTLRDYFAAKALPALILEESQADEYVAPYSTHLLREPDSGAPMLVAQAAYKFADAMLKEREA